MRQQWPASIEKIITVRRNYFDDGREIDGAIDPAIYRSWTRCVSTAKRENEVVEFDQIGPSRISELVQRNKALLDAASEPLKDLEKAVSGAGYAVLLTDSRGVAISVGGALDLQHRDIQIAFRQGVDLSEDAIGTSAMACALYERRPVRVFGPEHFFCANERFHCAAAPIIDPRGGLIGSVDITRGSRQADFGALSLVTRCSQAIEYELFRKIPAKVIITLSWQPLSEEHYSDLIFALGADGEILASNESARRFIGADAYRTNLEFEDVFEGRFGNTIAALEGAKLPYSINLRSGIRMFASIWRRDKSVSVIVTASEKTVPFVPIRIKNSTSSPPVLLEFGDDCINQQLGIGHQAYENGLPILILGETGTGKDVVARAIHAKSSRSNSQFVAINCAAIPETLIESELFGHEEGAFTGAKRGGVAGKIEQANSGTLFLDEIGDMPIHLQGRLLRVLENKEVTRLGGREAIKVDFQIICATHQNIQERIDAGHFRMDLFYRINGFSLSLPPLRERLNLEKLVKHMIDELSSGKRRISASALEQLAKYSWPGNIRELKHALIYANAIAESRLEIEAEHLPKSVQSFSVVKGQLPAIESRGVLNSMENLAIKNALKDASGNVGVAANVLGISRATLYRRLKVMGNRERAQR